MSKDDINKRKSDSKQDAPEFDVSTAPSFIRKPIEWFRNYWYYYKMYVVIGVPLLLAIFVLIISPLTKKKCDYTVVVSAGFTVSGEDLEMICEKLTPYLPDADGNGKVVVTASDLTLREKLDDEYYAQSYNKLAQMMVFDEAVFFITDTYSYNYLKEHGYIEPFSEIGAGDSDEYELSLAGHPILEGTEVENYADWHLLVKVQTEVNMKDEVYLARRAGTAEMIKALKAE